MKSRLLTVAAKKEIMARIVKAAGDKAINQDEIAKHVRMMLQACYQEIYGDGELHRSVQNLIEAGLYRRLASISLERAYYGDLYHDVRQAYAVNEWRNFLVGNKLEQPFNSTLLTSVYVVLENDELALPHDLMSEVVKRHTQSPQLREITGAFNNATRQMFAGVPAALASLRVTYSVIKSCKTADSLIDKLPDLKDLVNQVLSKTGDQPPSTVDATQLRSFISSIKPIEAAI